MKESYQRNPIGGCCKDCKERFPACHDVCATYLKAKAEWNELQEQIREKKKHIKIADSFHYEQVWKIRKIAQNKKGSKKR